MELAPGLARLTAPNPGLMTGAGTNTYLVGTAEVAVVDPGPDRADHRRRLLEAVRARGGTLRWVLVTHTHPDHAPGANALAAAAGVPAVGMTAGGGFRPDVEAGDGAVVAGAGVTLTAVHTPGHASDHLCWRHAETGVLLSGDHLMDGATVVIRPPDGDMAVYLASLAAVRGGQVAVAPGHGGLITDPDGAIDAVVAHRLGRERAVAAALAAAGPSTVDDLLHRVYADVAAELLPVARFSLWAHLRKLAAEGRAEALTDGPDDLETTWRPAG